MPKGNDLPDRDVLVLYQDDADRKKQTDPHWIQANFQEADGEYDEDGCIRGHNDRHVIVYSDDELDLKHVTAWEELPVLP